MKSIDSQTLFNSIGELSREPKSFFGFSFLSWQGNKLTFSQSKWVVIVIYLLLFLTCLSIFLFKSQIRKQYLNKPNIVVNVFQIYGFIIISLSIFRIIILAIGGYPNLWELIPFHFCRMFVIIIGSLLIFRKLSLIKYFGIFAIGGGIFGLLIPDLGNSPYWSQYGGMDIGIDNYIFWDYFIIHTSSIIMPIYLFTCLKPSIYKSTISYSLLWMGIFTIFVFILDIALSNVPNPRWRPNWFYVGIPKLNGIDDKLSPILGPLSGYPTILFTFIAIGIFVYVGLTTIYIYSDSLDFIWINPETKKVCFRIKKIKSQNLFILKEGPKKYKDNYNL